MEQLRKIQAELKAPKNQRNNFGKYNYRSCEDILEAVKPLLDKHECTLTVSDEVKELGGYLFVESTSIISSGSMQKKVTAQAGIDPNRKGMDIAQSFGSSSSYSRKYSLNGLFLIDDTKDADSTNTHGKTATKLVEPKDNKPWLNENTPEFTKVKGYLKGGGKIEKVEEKYKISKSTKESLNN